MDTADANTAITAIIPAYNEGLVIGSVVLNARQYAGHVIVVDDGSKDNTSEIARLAGAEVITLEQNAGKSHAMMIAFARAKEIGSPATVMLDGDGQHDPAEIPAVAAPVLAGAADLVVGSRFLNAKDSEEIPGYRQFGQKVLNKATNVSSGMKCSDSQSGYRALSRKAMENMDFAANGYGIESEMLAHFAERGLVITEVPITVTYEVPHKHKMNPVKHGLSVLGGIIQLVSIKRPLVCFGVPGFILTVVGIFMAVQAFDIVAKTGVWSTNVTLVAMMMLLMGMLLIITALILFSISALMRK